MRSHIYIIIYGLTALCFCGHRENMTGQKKQVKKKTITTIVGETATLVTEFYYDTAGRETRQVQLLPGGKTIFILHKNYDVHGQLLQQTQEDLREGSSGKTVTTFTNMYDEQKRISTQVAQTPGQRTVTENYRYLPNGAFEVMIREGNEVTGIKSFNPLKQLVRREQKPGGKIMELFYDIHNNLLEQREKTPGRPVRLIKYLNKYDDAGRRVSVTEGNMVTKYVYDADGNILEETMEDEQGHKQQTNRYTYEFK